MAPKRFTAKWIWHPDTDTQEGINQYVEFRREFELTGPVKNARVCISADSHYEFWMNGTLIDWGQYQSWPQDRVYNVLNVDHVLKPGRNVIAVRACYRGENFIIYARGKAGVFLEMTMGDKVVASTDQSWLCRKSPTYKSGPISKMTMQARFNFEYNAQHEDGWQAGTYTVSDTWSQAQELAPAVGGYWKTLTPRPVKMLRIFEPVQTTVVAAGTFTRTTESETVARTLSHESRQLRHDTPGLDKLPGSVISPEADRPLIIGPMKGQQGVCLVFDLGREESGYLCLNADAPAGTIFDMAHGEFLDAGTVRCEIDGRNFADRYICKEGRNTWQYSFNRIGCRYLQLHIPAVTDEIKLYYVTVRPSQYPFEYQGDFECSDSALNKLWCVGRRTLELCANEHYEDCPWREQALYGTDHRYQALYGYYTFGETELPAACWDLLGGGLNEDGLLELTAPGRLPVNIPSFTYHWISAVWELLLYSGDTEPARRQFERICIVLDKTLHNLTADNMVENFKGDRYWHLYEWTNVLKGDLSEYKAIIDPGAREYDAMNNLLIIESLRNAASIAAHIQDGRSETYREVADEIGKAFHPVFWDDRKKLYASYRRGDRLFHQSQFVQAYAIKEKVVPSQHLTSYLLGRIANSAILSRAELPSKMFIYDVLLSFVDTYESWVLNDIQGTFCEMIEMGATSLWEVIGGEERFQCAGSLCHGWSAVFNYIAGAQILGVRPLSPGFKTFAVAPRILGMPCASGMIPTPYGPIQVRWRDNPAAGVFELFLKHPNTLEVEITAPFNRTLKLLDK